MLATYFSSTECNVRCPRMVDSSTGCFFVVSEVQQADSFSAVSYGDIFAVAVGRSDLDCILSPGNTYYLQCWHPCLHAVWRRRCTKSSPSYAARHYWLTCDRFLSHWMSLTSCWNTHWRKASVESTRLMLPARCLCHKCVILSWSGLLRGVGFTQLVCGGVIVVDVVDVFCVCVCVCDGLCVTGPYVVPFSLLSDKHMQTQEPKIMLMQVVTDWPTHFTQRALLWPINRFCHTDTHLLRCDIYWSD